MSKTGNSPQAASPTGERLQKVLAQAGHGSRRQCEELILAGRVTVDGKVVDQLGFRVSPEEHRIELDGTPVRIARYQYFMVHKPPGVLSTTSDPAGRVRVIDLVNTDQRVYNVGRLDKSSEGLILVTNDGELANRLTHPRYGVQKTYLVHASGRPAKEDLDLLRRGVRLAEGVAKVTEIRVKRQSRDYCEMFIVLDEGRNREIRRLLARIGHKVTKLKRVAIGPLQMGDLAAGSWRRLTAEEIQSLRKASSKIREKRPKTSKPFGTGRLEKLRRLENESLGAEKALAPRSGFQKRLAGKKPAVPGSARRDETHDRSRVQKSQQSRRGKARLAESSPKPGWQKGGAPKGGAPRGGALKGRKGPGRKNRPPARAAGKPGRGKRPRQ
jgi:23S rRNA pseudouridine2605 synthase